MPSFVSASEVCSDCAKYTDTACWCSFKTLTPKKRFCLRRDRRWLRWSTQTRVRNGSRETEVKELPVIPYAWPGARGAVMTVTPVANWPSAWRKSVAVRGVVLMFEVFEDNTLGGTLRKRRPPAVMVYGLLGCGGLSMVCRRRTISGAAMCW